MANDFPLPANLDGFDRFFETNLASMTPDLYPAFLNEIMHQIEAWWQRQAESPSRSEAMRRLIEIGLAAPAPVTPPETD